LDEAERCSRVALMDAGKILMTDSPANLKNVMNGEVVELVCSNIRGAFSLLKKYLLVKEVQAFGDRLNLVVNSSASEMETIVQYLKTNSIEISDWRVVKPSLENVFISLLTDRKINESSNKN
jgi:ABC-2 type transport system ATP-binding protein